MSVPLIRMKFDRQEGDNYYFLAGFYNEGIDLLVNPGNFPSQHTVLDVIGQLPIALTAGQYVGSYQVPEHMLLRAAKGRPWIFETDLIPDLLINWYDVLGYLYLDWYEVLYSPTGEPLPEPYLSKESASLTHPTLPDKYYLPRNESDWPADSSEYETISVAHSVSLEGCQLMGEWASLWSAANEWHMLTLIGTQPKLPQEPNILTRWRETHAASGMERSEGSYNDQTPQYDFRGWTSPFSNNGKIEILQGLSTSIGDLIITGSSGIIIPYLSPTKSGDQVTVGIPYALESTPPEDNLVFVFPGTPTEPGNGVITPFTLSLPTILGTFLLGFPSHSEGSHDFLPGFNFQLKARDVTGYGLADTTYPVADSTYPVAGLTL